MIIGLYFIFVNILAFGLMGDDKGRAQRAQGRISEGALLALAAAGGSPGVWAGMYCFRHKTRHRAFTLGVPALLALQLLAAALLWLRLSGQL